MKHLKYFEDNTTNPDLVIEDLGDSYRVNKMEIEGAIYLYLKEKQEVVPGDNQYELCINYDINSLINSEDLQNTLNYLETLPGIVSIIHRMGVKFELTFDKPIKII